MSIRFYQAKVNIDTALCAKEKKSDQYDHLTVTLVSEAGYNPTTELNPFWSTSVLIALVKTMRPRQWLKNGLVYVPLFFDGKLTDLNSLIRTAIAFVLLCMMSSAVYIMNDLMDMEKDRQHPSKRNRPLASGDLSPWLASVVALVLGLASLVAGYFLAPRFCRHSPHLSSDPGSLHLLA